MLNKIKSIYILLLIYTISNVFNILNYSLEVNFIIVFIEVLVYYLFFLTIGYGFKKLLKIDHCISDFLTSCLLFLIIFFSNISQVFRESYLDQAVMLMGINYRFLDLFVIGLTYLFIFLILTRVVKRIYNYEKLFSIFLIFLLGFMAIEKINFKPNEVILKDNFSVINSKNELNTSLKPDIYYIILDAYTSNESLHSNFGHNNSSFTKSLEDLGFFIATEAKSNYNYTSSSTAATLNMSYLNLSDNAVLTSKNLAILDSLVTHNRVQSLLKQAGYNMFSYSIFDFGLMKGRSFGVSTARKYDLSFFSLISKGFNKYFSNPDNDKYYFNCYKYNIGAFTYLDSIRRIRDTPKFTIIHSLAAHSPFVLDSLGNFEPEQNINPKRIRAKYVKSVKYLNNNLVAQIRNILNQPGGKPIIIIQGDHGSHLVNISETSSIFSAYYFPPEFDIKLARDISPVNSFRVTLDKIFNMNHRLLENNNYHISYGKR